MPATSAGAFAEPQERVGRGYISAFALAWLGIWMAQLVPYQLLLPTQVETVLPAGGRWQDSVITFGVVSGIGGVLSLIAYPLAGTFSDRTISRLGRRRPWIFGGAVLFAAGIVLLGFASDASGVILGWSIVSIGFCVTTAALTATIADRVPIRQRGAVGAWISAPQALGGILGILIVELLFPELLSAYLALAVMLILAVLPMTLRGGDPVLPREARAPFSLRVMLAGLWISPRSHPDFAWTLSGRILVNIATAVPQAIAPLFGALVVVWLGGFTGLYLLAGATALLGALCVWPVRSVR